MPRTERDGLPRAAGNRLLAALPDDVFTHLEPDLRQLTLPQGVVCYGAGDPIDQVYFPHTGMISQLIATGDGDMVETSSIGREGAVGLQCGLGSRLSFTRATVQIPGRFSAISAARFEQAASVNAGLRDLIMHYTETLWAEAQQNAACNAIHDGSSRLCRWLLQCADRTGSEQLLLTQEFLAEMLGVRRTTHCSPRSCRRRASSAIAAAGLQFSIVRRSKHVHASAMKRSSKKTCRSESA